ncbi:MAG: hypothetical protein OIF50_13615 [Flavobacteriaceae bacterium]|nr:hypothetical protein [Flavobacteriaceae bacterium]
MKYTLLFLAMTAFVFVSCSDDDDNATTSTLTLNLTGLEDLGDAYRYEGWVIVNGTPVSTGIFSVDDAGKLSQTKFNIPTATLSAATKFVLTIEPHPDKDKNPSKTKYLAGDFTNNTATIGTSTVASNFSNIAGKYIIAAPTGTAAMNEANSGIWFIDNSSGSMMAGLNLPTLNEGWKYEGWVVIDGKPLTTGTFTATNVADMAAPFSGTKSGPAFPGEDFLKNAPTGITFPTDLRGKTAVISIEPSPDNSTKPFTLKPLAGMIPANHTGVGSIANNVMASFPKGTVTR